MLVRHNPEMHGNPGLSGRRVTARVRS